MSAGVERTAHVVHHFGVAYIYFVTRHATPESDETNAPAAIAREVAVTKKRAHRRPCGDAVGRAKLRVIGMSDRPVPRGGTEHS